MMRKIRSFGVALAAVTLLASCSGLDSLGSNRVSGTYELRDVNGDRVPSIVIEQQGYRMEVLSAVFTLEDDGSYSEAGIVRETTNGFSTTRATESFGFYDYFNGELTFDEDNGRRYYGTTDGGLLIIEDQGLRLTYERY